MHMFSPRRSDDHFGPGVPGVMQVTPSGIWLLCRADKHVLADLDFDGTLRIWDRRCKTPFTFDLAGSLPVGEKERTG